MKKLVALSIAIACWRIATGETVPSLINYQGRLTDPTGTPLPKGNYGIEFRLWDSLAGDSSAGLIWAQQQNVALQANGVFNVILGAAGASAIPGTTPSVNDLAFAFSSSSRYLGVTIVSSNGLSISTPVEIAPRQQLLSVPFAVMSQQVADGAVGLQQNSQAAANALVPPGTIVAYAGDLIPKGWLVCDGDAVSRTVYSNLWTAIRSIWGVGDGSTTFHLPDLQGMFLRGVDVSAGRDPDKANRTAPAIGGNAGPLVGSIQSDGFRQHTHQISVAANQQDFGSEGSGTPVGALGEGANPYALTNVRGGSETRPKNAYVNYIIKY